MALTTGMAIAAGISAASSLAGGAMAKSAAKKASKAQVQASQDANAAQQRMFEIMQLLGIGGDKAAAGYGSMAKAFGTDQFQQDPGYAFRQSEGMKALERSAAARGNLMSGSTMKGIQRFGQDLASQEYQNAFNRYQVERSARLNPLQSLMGSGQSAANVMTGAAGQMGQNEASNIYNAGQARASGYIGQANALNTALGQIGGMVGQMPMQNAMMDSYRGNTFDSKAAKGPGFGSGTTFNLTGRTGP